MDCFRFDTSNNLVSVSNAILKHFTGTCFHEPQKDIERILASKNYKKVVLMLFDGLGKSIREKHLHEKDFLRRKKKFEITSVFPPTTVAATTSVCSGKYPVETGWLGWQQYFKTHNVVVDMFTNCNSLNGDLIKGPKLADLYCSYTPIWELIKNSGIKAGAVYPKPIDPAGPQSLDEFFEVANILMKKDESHFYYMYWTGPDSQIHQYGTNHRIVHEHVKLINKKVARLAKENKDNLIIVLADHSLVDTLFLDMYEHSDFGDTIERIFSIDSRSASFHVKSGLNEQFIESFNKYYGDKFLLLSKQEVIDQKWFGLGEEHPLFRDFLGDYLATSTSQYAFKYEGKGDMIGAHAGSLEEESIIDVSIINI